MHITQHTQRSQTRLRHHSAYGLASLAAVALLTALASALGAAAQLPSPPPPAMPTPDEDGYQGSAVKHSTHAQTAHKRGLVKLVFSSPVPPRTRTSSPHLTSSTTKPGLPSGLPHLALPPLASTTLVLEMLLILVLLFMSAVFLCRASPWCTV